MAEPHAPSLRPDGGRRSNLGAMLVFGAVLAPLLAILLPVFSPGIDRLASVLHASANTTRLVDLRRQPRPNEFPLPPYCIFSSQVVLPAAVRAVPAYVCVNESGVISTVASSLLSVTSAGRRTVVDVSPLVVMPGLIDVHVHVNAPGREEWEGVDTATRAAAAGGTTAILDMPLNNIPSTIDAASLRMKEDAWRAAEPVVDVGFIGGVVPESLGRLHELLDGGVVALKTFLVATGTPEFRHLDAEQLRAAVKEIDSLAVSRGNALSLPYILHAEVDDGLLETGARGPTADGFDHSSYRDYERTRPGTWEMNAVRLIVSAINNTRVHAHVAHVAETAVLDVMRSAHMFGLGDARLTGETCSHYLLFTAEEIKSGGTLYKCSPPIRSDVTRKRLVDDVFGDSGSVLEVVASDHSPCPSDLKDTNGNVTRAWGGVAGLQYRLGATWRAAREKGVDVSVVSRVLSEAPARLFGLDRVKGALQTGREADIVIWDANSSEVISSERCEHKQKASAFDGWRLDGVVKYTLLRGRVVYGRGENNVSWFISNGGRFLQRARDTSVTTVERVPFVGRKNR